MTNRLMKMRLFKFLGLFQEKEEEDDEEDLEEQFERMMENRKR